MFRDGNLLKILSYPLGVHLLYTNTMLLIQHYAVYYGSTATAIDVVFRIIFAMSYSWLTIIVLNKYPKIVVFSILAAVDGTGVMLKYIIFANKTQFANMVAIYFSVYTALIIVVSGLIIKTVTNSKPVATSETKSEVISNTETDIIAKKRSLQNRINATRDAERKKALQSELESLELIVNN